MKVKETAFGKYLNTLSVPEQIKHIEDSLRNGSDSIPWQVVEKFDLSASNPRELATKVSMLIMDFEV